MLFIDSQQKVLQCAVAIFIGLLLTSTCTTGQHLKNMLEDDSQSHDADKFTQNSQTRK